MEKEEEETKIKYDLFAVKDFEKSSNYKTYYKKIEYSKSIEYSIKELEKFEKESGVEIFLYFNHLDLTLTLFDYLPNDLETKRICHQFLDSLNQGLENHLKEHRLKF